MLQLRESILTKARTAQLGFSAFALFTVAFFVWAKPTMAGDGGEYFHILESFANHASPDLRTQDVQSLHSILNSSQPYSGFFESKSGAYYSWHFWLYPLAALPAKLLLRVSGLNQLAAFQVTNAVIFLLAVYVALFKNNSPIPKRLLFAGLSIVSPVMWYLSWPSPEAFTWSMVVISLVAIDNHKYFLAALSASMGAMQYPPIMFLTAYAVVAAIWETRKPTRVLPVLFAGSLTVLPNLFYLLTFGVPNLIIKMGFTDFHLVSFGRTLSFLFDLNQGMAPYMPLSVVLFGWAIVWAGKARKASGIVGGMLFFIMLLFSEPTTNWNSATAGVMRYAVWLTPVLAWTVTESLWMIHPARWLVATAVTLQAVVLVLAPHGPGDYVKQSPLASFVLRHAPGLYNPEPEIFADRQLHQEVDYYEKLPIAFADGEVVTKVLTNTQSLGSLKSRLSVQEQYYQRVSRMTARRTGLFYLTPPRGAIMIDVPSVKELDASVGIASSELPRALSSPQLRVLLIVSNRGISTLWDPSSAVPYQLNISYHIKKESSIIIWDGTRSPLPRALAPGEAVEVPLDVQLPKSVGNFIVEVAPVLEGVTWGQPQLEFEINVVDASDNHYSAEVITHQP